MFQGEKSAEMFICRARNRGDRGQSKRMGFDHKLCGSDPGKHRNPQF